jgi:hypothetical protein
MRRVGEGTRATLQIPERPPFCVGLLLSCTSGASRAMASFGGSVTALVPRTVLVSPASAGGAVFILPPSDSVMAASESGGRVARVSG